ncbi:MAG: ABC-F family ATP-binding cassette domain-containing protein [Lachnospiraceae bacterium]|nr:ABC-F family ATP-binding cassette domain-containing protein [Lachnospiraceae bacterium]
MLLDVQHIAKSYDGIDILTDVSFHLEEKQKAAIVGINGAGKTTLLRQIVGEEEPDRGNIIFPKELRIGYLAQYQDFDLNTTIYRAVFEVNQELLSLENSIRAAEQAMPSLSGDALTQKMNEYARATEQFERMNGYAYRSEVTGVLKGLGFSEDQFQTEAAVLSGGQKTRLSLARILLSRPDLLILDEPTNHLDMDSVAWLENYLISYPGAVLLVSHDRYFLNRIVSRIIEIENGTGTVYNGNYDQYTEKREMLRKAQLSAFLAAQRKIEHEQAVIDKLRSFNREKSIKRAESREKKIAKIETPDRPVQIDTDIRLTLTPSRESGNDVLMIEDLSKSFDDLMLFKDFDLLIRKGERVALIGSNGTGKSTILKIINGLLPADSGMVRLGSNVEIGYYDQENQLLHMEKTIFQEISDEWPAMNNTRIRSVLAAFLFTGEDVFKRIGDLSGGERARVSLARLMLSNANLLILDEPTNHLDIHSRAILENALRSYTGTVFCVSHDRYFINRTATRVLELSGQTVTSYSGNYDDYLEDKARRTENRMAANTGGSPLSSNTVKNQSAAASREQSGKETLTEKEAWLLKKQEEAARRKKENDIKKTEAEIEKCENRCSEIETLLSDLSIASDPVQCAALTAELSEMQDKISLLMDRWEELQL